MKVVKIDKVLVFYAKNYKKLIISSDFQDTKEIFSTHVLTNYIIFASLN